MSEHDEGNIIDSPIIFPYIYHLPTSGVNEDGSRVVGRQSYQRTGGNRGRVGGADLIPRC